MSKQVQILLSRPLTVNLGTDKHGQPISVKLSPGLQHVEPEIAENWFVKAHCQEISSNDIQTGELQKQLDIANEALQALQTQSDEATKKIGQLEDNLKERDTEIANLKIQLDKALQTQSDEATKKIGQLEGDLKERDTEIANLKIQLDKALQTQSDEATKKIGQLEGDLKERDTEIANLKIQLDKALQTQSSDMKTKDPAKAKDAPKET